MTYAPTNVEQPDFECHYPVKTEKDLDKFFDEFAEIHLKMMKKGKSTHLAPWIYLVTGIEQDGKPVIVEASPMLRQIMDDASSRYPEDDRAPVEAMWFFVHTISKSMKPVAILLQHQGWQLHGEAAENASMETRPKHHKDREHVMLSQMVALNREGQLYKTYTQSDVMEETNKGNFLKYGKKVRMDQLANERSDLSFSRFEEAAIWAKN